MHIAQQANIVPTASSKANAQLVTTATMVQAHRKILISFVQQVIIASRVLFTQPSAPQDIPLLTKALKLEMTALNAKQAFIALSTVV